MPTHYVHRGLFKKNFNENTLTSFKYSFKEKFGVETDLHVSKDNQFVCFHDFNLKKKFKINKKIKDTYYLDLKKISKRKKAEIPLLKSLLEISKNKYPLLLEVKPLLKEKNLSNLIKLVKKIKNYKIISFKEKNLQRLYRLKKNLPLGLLFKSTASIKIIKLKSKKKYVKFLVLEKKYLSERKIKKIKKEVYYYTIKNKKIYNKYKNKNNLVFENF